MKKEKLQKSNTSRSLSNGPLINDPGSEFGKDLMDALSRASESFDKPLMSRDELDKVA